MELAGLVMGVDSPHAVAFGVVYPDVGCDCDLRAVDEYPQRRVVVRDNLAVARQTDIDDIPVSRLFGECTW